MSEEIEFIKQMFKQKQSRDVIKEQYIAKFGKINNIKFGNLIERAIDEFSCGEDGFNCGKAPEVEEQPKEVEEIAPQIIRESIRKGLYGEGKNMDIVATYMEEGDNPRMDTYQVIKMCRVIMVQLYDLSERLSKLERKTKH